MFKNNLNNIDLNNLTEESAAPNIAKISSKNDITIMNEMMEKDKQFIQYMKQRIKGLEKITDEYKKCLIVI